MGKRDFDFRDGKREHLPYAFGRRSESSCDVPKNVRLMGHLQRSIQAPKFSPEKRVEKWEPVVRVNPLFANELTSMAMTDLVPLFAFTQR